MFEYVQKASNKYVLITSVQGRNDKGVIYSISQEICTRCLLCCVCCGYTLTDFPISIRLTSLVLWQSNDCPSARKATLMNMDKYFMWILYERLHNHNKAKHSKNCEHISWDILYGRILIYNIWWLTEMSPTLSIGFQFYMSSSSYPFLD